MDELFEKRMKDLLKEDYSAWLDAFDQEQSQALRLSPRKQPVSVTREELGFLRKPSPFARNTWYIHGRYGLHPAHLQGLFYLQEPSAGSAVSALDVKPDDSVLDLCAAPGSKSTQILEALGENGYLLSNEIEPKRAQILLSNLERMGAENFAVTNMDSKTLCRQLPAFFDKLLVDAPCSGEGMMKKHNAARDEWSIANVLLCSARQKDILKEAWQALKPGGSMVYSTCTYAPEENEENVAWILETFDDAVLLPIEGDWGRSGYPIGGLNEEQAAMVRRIFPMDGGEGHFVARIGKKESPEQEQSAKKKSSLLKKSDALPKEAEKFLDEQLEENGTNGGFAYYQTQDSKDGMQVYGSNTPFLNLKKGKVLRQGVQIGTVTKKRFEPAFAFYLCLTAAKHLKTKTETDLQAMDDYYHGTQLSIAAPAGYRALCYRGVPYGFGKSSSGRITNKLPKGLRLTPSSHLIRDDAAAEEVQTEPR